MDDWPALPYDDWRDTRDTLHMYTQIVGKIRLALSPFEPQWANVPLYVTARGLTTSTVPDGLRTFDVEFDLVDHRLIVRASDGGIEELPLRARAVADFYEDVMGALGRLGIDVTISPGPSEVPDPIPFAEDRVHHSYEPADAKRFFHVLSQVDVVLKEHRSKFNGKTTPAHFFWGSFDHVVARFSGRVVTPPPEAGTIERYGGDAEQICGGFWPGHPGFPSAAFFAYGYPKPDGIEHASIGPEGAGWNNDIGEFVFPYDAMRAAPDRGAHSWSFSRAPTTRAREQMGWSPDLTRVNRPS